MNKNIKRAYSIALLNILLVLTALSTIVSSESLSEFQAGYLVGLPVLLSGLLAVIGFVFFYLGRNAKRSYQYYLGGFVNFIIILIVLALFWGNLKQ